MAAVSSPRLDQLAERVRLRAVGWESYARAGLLSNSDVELVQRAAGSQGDSIRNGEDEETYAALYTRLLANLNRNEARSSVLALLADFIAADGKQDGRMKLILKQSPYEALLKLLDTSDDFIKLEATAVLCTLVGADQEVAADVVDRLLTHIARLFGGSGVDSSAASTSSGQSGSGSTADPDTQLVAAQSLAALFRRSDARQAAWKRDAAPKSDSKGKSNGDQPDKSPRAIAPLVAILRTLSVPSNSSGRSTPLGALNGPPSGTAAPSSAGTAGNLGLQLQYHVVFCLWLLSYEDSFCEGVNKAYGGMIPALVELARNAVKEKVVRVVLATFRNLVTRAPDANTAALLNAKCPAYLSQLQQSRRWGDDEVREDVDFLAQELKNAKQKLTTYDEYVAELESGDLSWTPPHEDAEFWRNNAEKLNAKDREQLKALIKILTRSKTPLVLSVALNDVGQYVKNCDNGKKNIEELGGKARAMELIQHPDSDVKFRALMTVQKLVSHSWAS